MPVKLSRFVRVMSGGKIVTDELVTARDGKVGVALGELQGEIDRLGAVGVRIPVLEDTHRDLTDARTAANAETSNADKGAALEAVKFDARDAVTDARQQVAPALVTGNQRAQKLGEVDAALPPAQNAVTAIADDSLRAPLALQANALRGRRDALAGATDLGSIATEIANAPALLADIGALALDAGRVDAIAHAKAARLGEVDAAMQGLANAEAGIGGAGFKGPITALIQGLAPRRDALANAADPATATAETSAAPALLADIGTATGTAQAAAKAEADVAGKLTEVDTALLGLTNAVAGVAGAGFKDPVAAPVAGLTGRRDTLAGAADVATAATELGKADALIAEIGTATAAATRAATAEADQATQLGLVDAALAALRNEEATIGAPVLRAPVTLGIAGLAGQRDTLAGAADTATAEAQVALAGALLLDIGTATTAAHQASVNATALNSRTAALDTRMVSIGKWIDVLKAGSPKTALEQRRDALALDRTALDTAAIGSLAGNLVAAETGTRTLLEDARVEAAAEKRASADLWLAAFKGWETSIAKISPTNPVTAETATLRLEKSTADAVVDAGGRRTALSTFITHAAALQTKVENMKAAKVEIEKIGMTITALLTLKPPPTVAPTALALERTTVLAGLPGAFNQASTDAVMTQLATLKSDMLAIKPKAEDWRAGQLDLDALKASVAKSLADARVVVDKLAAGDPKTQMDAALLALVVRQTATATMDPAAAGKALFAIQKEALALLEKAHKQGFAEQLALPDGKQKIDDLIKTFGDKAADPQSQAVCKAALAARFNLDVEVLEGLSVDRLPRLFNLFAQVPAAHVGHDKLLKLQYNTDPSSDASYYSGGDKKIVLVMGESDGTYPYTAQSGTAVENLNYFSATTLHEIGHGVDAKQGIMSDSRMAGAEFGGWQKETIETVTEAFYTKSFASFVAASGPTEPDLRALVKKVLETGACAKPADATAPLGSLFAKWTEISTSQGFKDCVAIRNPGVSPWNKPVAAGARAYHEGYDGRWFSYLVAERAKGISNYQWRAPPEWFAELYAYYHMTKKAVPASVEAYIKG